MKQVLVVMGFFLAAQAAAAQTSSTLTPAVKAQMKTGLAARSAYTPGKGDFLTSSVTAQLNPKLSLTAVQDSQMNDALHRFFQVKKTFRTLRLSDPNAYQPRQDAAYADLVAALEKFLSSGQMSAFQAARPASANTSTVLTLVYY